MSIFNSQGWHWTTWSYKVTGNSSWGIYNHSPQSVDIYNDSADTIKNKWSAVGTSSAWKNNMIYNVVKEYLPGKVSSTGEAVHQIIIHQTVAHQVLQHFMNIQIMEAGLYH